MGRLSDVTDDWQRFLSNFFHVLSGLFFFLFVGKQPEYHKNITFSVELQKIMAISNRPTEAANR